MIKALQSVFRSVCAITAVFSTVCAFAAQPQERALFGVAAAFAVFGYLVVGNPYRDRRR